MAKKALGAPEARERWNKCTNEFATLIKEEVENNPRYHNIQMSWPSESLPPST